MQILFVEVTIKIKMDYLILPVGSINCCQRNLLFVTPILYQLNSLKIQVRNMLRNIKQINSYPKKLAVAISKMTSLVLLFSDRCLLWESYQTNECLLFANPGLFYVKTCDAYSCSYHIFFKS